MNTRIGYQSATLPNQNTQSRLESTMSKAKLGSVCKSESKARFYGFRVREAVRSWCGLQKITRRNGFGARSRRALNSRSITN
jgi:hypothetical protein